MAREALRPVVLWVLPNYVAILALITLALPEPSIPLRMQHTLEGFWMLFALLLPISTIIAALKAVQLSLGGGGEQLYVWAAAIGWCLVAVALGFNVFSFIIISRTLR